MTIYNKAEGDPWKAFELLREQRTRKEMRALRFTFLRYSKRYYKQAEKSKTLSKKELNKLKGRFFYKITEYMEGMM